MTGAKNKRVRKFALWFSGATLVSIRDEAEQRFIEKNLMLLKNRNHFWIGLFLSQKGNTPNIHLHTKISSVFYTFQAGPEFSH